MFFKKRTSKIIGICVSETKSRFVELVKERLEKYSGDLTIIRFRVEDVDFENRCVKGDHLEKKNGVIQVTEGDFSLPGAIFLQCYVAPSLILKLQELIGLKVFNSFQFDKWQCFELLNKTNALKPFLPETMRMEDKKELFFFLNSHHDIFLKPIDVLQGHSSKGIFHIKRLTNKFIQATYHKKGKFRKKVFHNYKKCIEWLFPQLSRDYIMQKSIQTLKWKENVTDIRLNMNKNGQGEWENTLLILRVASNSSHMTRQVAAAVPLKKIIQPFLKSPQNIEEIEAYIRHIGFQICEVLDQSGAHMADLGIDLGVDEKGHPWIFEVNPLPSPINDVGDHSLTRPLEYATFLILRNAKRVPMFKLLKLSNKQ